FDNIKQALSDKGNAIVFRSRDLFAQKGGNASGTMSRETRTDVFLTPSTIEMEVTTVGYFRYADEGRGPTKAGGKGEVKKKVREWMRQKGITPKDISFEEAVYLITRKIHKEGFKGKFYVRDIVTENDKRALDSAVTDAVLKDFNL
ncbi:MAG TPA: hypothetical protein VGD31_12055, partial [Sphingobacteriaceae bacterium]